jgi:hypothetical protein
LPPQYVPVDLWSDQLTQTISSSRDARTIRRIDVVENSSGRSDELKQTAYFDAAWPQHDHEIIERQEAPRGYVAVESVDDAVHVHELVAQGRGTRR